MISSKVRLSTLNGKSGFESRRTPRRYRRLEFPAASSPTRFYFDRRRLHYSFPSFGLTIRRVKDIQRQQGFEILFRWSMF